MSDWVKIYFCLTKPIESGSNVKAFKLRQRLKWLNKRIAFWVIKSLQHLALKVTSQRSRLVSFDLCLIDCVKCEGKGRLSETLEVHFLSRFQFDLLLTFVSCFIKERKFNCRWFSLSLVVSSSRSYVGCLHLQTPQWREKWLATERQVPLFTLIYKANISLSFNFSFFLIPPHPRGNCVANLWLNFYWVIAKTFLDFFCQR